MNLKERYERQKELVEILSKTKDERLLAKRDILLDELILTHKRLAYLELKLELIELGIDRNWT